MNGSPYGQHAIVLRLEGGGRHEYGSVVHGEVPPVLVRHSIPGAGGGYLWRLDHVEYRDETGDDYVYQPVPTSYDGLVGRGVVTPTPPEDRSHEVYHAWRTRAEAAEAKVERVEVYADGLRHGTSADRSRAGEILTALDGIEP